MTTPIASGRRFARTRDSTYRQSSTADRAMWPKCWSSSGETTRFPSSAALATDSGNFFAAEKYPVQSASCSSTCDCTRARPGPGARLVGLARQPGAGALAAAPRRAPPQHERARAVPQSTLFSPKLSAHRWPRTVRTATCAGVAIARGNLRAATCSAACSRRALALRTTRFMTCAPHTGHGPAKPGQRRPRAGVWRGSRWLRRGQGSCAPRAAPKRSSRCRTTHRRLSAKQHHDAGPDRSCARRSVPGPGGHPGASAALAVAWRRLHAWRATASGRKAPAPPEPPSPAGFLPAWRGHVWVCPGG